MAKALNGLGTSYISDLLLRDGPSRPSWTSLLAVLEIKTKVQRLLAQHLTVTLHVYSSFTHVCGKHPYLYQCVFNHVTQP